jgi:hypothetical protein
VDGFTAETISNVEFRDVLEDVGQQVCVLVDDGTMNWTAEVLGAVLLQHD